MPGDRDLPPPTYEFRRFVSTARVDRSGRDSTIEYLVGYCRVLAGDRRPLDEAVVRDFLRRDIDRARDFAAARNHDLLTEGESSSEPLSSIRTPTLVIHGTADPMFPVEHGEALAHEIPGARLLTLDGAGHGIHSSDLETIAAAINHHSIAADPAQ
jgi:pimeloyl-ACP methyl ester carboxylesterase